METKELTREENILEGNIGLRKDDKKYYHAQHDIDMCEMMFLCYLVNTRTDKCCFFDMSGHVGFFRIALALGKAEGNYERKIEEWHFVSYCIQEHNMDDLEGEITRKSQKLKEIVTCLKDLLNEEGVDYKPLYQHPLISEHPSLLTDK